MNFGFIGAPDLHFYRQVRVAIDIKTDAIFIRVSQFHDIDPFEVDHLTGKGLHRSLPFLEREAQDIVHARLDTF